MKWNTTPYRECALAVAALEACLMVGDAISGEKVDEMDGLVAGLALVLSAGEIHGEQLYLYDAGTGKARTTKTQSTSC
jgi:hypothetical protein